METGLKSRSLPHKRVLITIPDRTALGKRGLDFPPGGSGGVSASNITRGCGSQGGGQGCQDKLTENGRGCALILWIRLENKGTTYVKIHAVNCKMWNRGLKGLQREGNVRRVDSPYSLSICFP